MYYQTDNPHGGCPDRSVLDFSANVNPLGTPPAVLEAARDALAEVRRYPDPHCRALCAAVARKAGVPEDFVLCGAGASELIWGYCAALSPKSALEPAPTFSEYSAALARLGCRTARYPLRPELDFALDAGIIDRLERERPALLCLCNPNNPTGRRLDPALARRILETCEALGTRLLLDECFLSLSEDGSGSLIPLLASHPGLAILRAFTKSFGMAGLRLGVLLTADPALLRRISEATPPWNVSSVAQAAGLAALGEDAFLEESRRLIRRERETLSESLRALGLRVIPSEANFLLFSGPEGLGAAALRRGAALRDCRNFPGLGPGWYRIAVRTREENAALTAILRDCLKEV